MEVREKQVKLQSRYRSQAGGQRVVPELRLSGVWLEEIGLKVGEKVHISVLRHQLIIHLPENGKDHGD